MPNKWTLAALAFPMTISVSFESDTDQKKQPTVHCFYATPKGEAPTRTGQKWFKLISDGSELLNRIIQWSNTVQLTSATMMLTTRHDELRTKIWSITKMGLRESGYCGKLMTSPAGDVSMEEMHEQSSSSHHRPVGVEKILYWDSPEAKLLFFPCKTKTKQHNNQ